MDNLLKDIQRAGLDTRPPILDRTDFASWQQRIRLYCRGKDNEVNILKSIDERPYKFGTFRETLAESTEGTPRFGLERPRVYFDLNSEERDRYNADIRATNILLQGLPKDIYTLINHYTDAKDIWDNVKMLIEGSELTKEDIESQLYDDFEHFRQHKEESIHDYYVRFAKLINDIRNIKMTMSKLQPNSKFVNNMLLKWGRFVTAVKLNRGLRDSNYDQLFAYLKKHEAHAKENKMMLERLSQPTAQPTAYPLALLSNVSNTQHGSPSSSTSSFTQLPPPRANSSSPADDLIENLTSTLALLTQSYITFLSQTNNQLRTSSNARNQTTIQDGRVVVQNVHGRPNRSQGMNPRVRSTAGYREAQNRVGNVNQGQARPGQARTDLALNVDNVFQAEDCDAFDSDVDEAPTVQTMFMANLLSADPITDEVGPSYELDILSEKMNDKMNDPECVTRKVKIAPHDYSKENLLATFTPQKQLTPKQIFWSNDLMKIKSEALRKQTKVSRPIKMFTVYPPNTPAALVRKSLTKEVKEMKYVFEELEAEVAQFAVDRKHDVIELKNLLIANENLIAECLSQEVFCVATNSELNAAQFTNMHVANTTAETRCLALEAELANLRETNNQDNQTELINHFSKLETTESQITKLTDPITNLQAQNDRFRAENDKVKQHYKQLYDSIKITRAKHIEQVTKLTTKNATLKTSVSKAKVQPLVLTRTKHAVDVEPIVPRLRNNREAHLDYLRHLKENVETIRDIVEEAKVVRPLDRSIVSACRYTQHS
nr:hypothetical protein [Tanacetum cinerariifolium]